MSSPKFNPAIYELDDNMVRQFAEGQITEEVLANYCEASDKFYFAGGEWCPEDGLVRGLGDAIKMFSFVKPCSACQARRRWCNSLIKPKANISYCEHRHVAKRRTGWFTATQMTCNLHGQVTREQCKECQDENC